MNDCLILSFEQDLYPPHQVDVDLSDSTGDEQKQPAGDDVEGRGVPLAEPITSNPIGSDTAALVRPPVADPSISAAPLGGGQKRKRTILVPKRKTTTSSDQVIAELPSYHGSRNRLNLVAVPLAFGRLFEAFQHVFQAIRTGTSAGAETQPAKKLRAPSMRRMLVPKYVISLTCISLLLPLVYVF